MVVSFQNLLVQLGLVGVPAVDELEMGPSSSELV